MDLGILRVGQVQLLPHVAEDLVQQAGRAAGEPVHDVAAQPAPAGNDGADGHGGDDLDERDADSGEQDKNLWSNLDELTGHDQLKFVICDEVDYQWSRAFMAEHGLSDKCEILFSPCWQQQEATQLAEWILRVDPGLPQNGLTYKYYEAGTIDALADLTAVALEFPDLADARRSDERPAAYTRRFLRGRQPLCGMGVMSSIDLTVMPACCRAVMALSRPDPGPQTRTSTSFTPNFAAFSAACCAAICPAKGVLLRLPLNPHVPALAQHNASPLVSVMVTVVLLNVAFT